MTKVFVPFGKARVSVVATMFLAALLLLAVMPYPTHAASLTEDQTKAVVTLLSSYNTDQATIDRVVEVLKKGSTKPVSTDQPQKPLPPPCEPINKTIHRGSQDDSVPTLQSFLNSQGYLASSSISGYFGPATEEALKHWQEAQGLASSSNTDSGAGVLGPKSRAAMIRACAPKPTALGQGNDNRGQGGDMPRDNASSTVRHEGPKPVCTLTASADHVSPGSSVLLTWSSTNATYSSSPNGTMGPNGSVTVNPSMTTTYKKTVFGPGGQASCAAIINVDQPNGASSTNTAAMQQLMVLAQPEMNLANVVSSGLQMPFALAVDSLTDVFVQLGVGQE